MVDETTDTSVNQQMIFYIKFLDIKQSTRNWETIVEYLDLTMPKNSTATIITDAIRVFELDPRKLVGFGADGFSTMMGPKSGVVVRLQSSGCPCIVGFHCPAHRLQLAILDVCWKGIRIHISVELILGHVHNVTRTVAQRRVCIL